VQIDRTSVFFLSAVADGISFIPYLTALFSLLSFAFNSVSTQGIP